jgi:hypothetical protein
MLTANSSVSCVSPYSCKLKVCSVVAHVCVLWCTAGSLEHAARCCQLARVCQHNTCMQLHAVHYVIRQTLEVLRAGIGLAHTTYQSCPVPSVAGVASLDLLSCNPFGVVVRPVTWRQTQPFGIAFIAFVCWNLFTAAWRVVSRQQHAYLGSSTAMGSRVVLMVNSWSVLQHTMPCSSHGLHAISLE